jgi:OmpA-OmpF porin, OOP family
VRCRAAHTNRRGLPDDAEEGGSDDEEASARNRRVEFSYDVGDEANEDSDGEGLDAGARNVASPAPFREEDGEIVASETHDDVQLDVYPLLRDGAYVITTIALTNTTDEPVELDLEAEDALPDGGPDTFSEGTLGGFQLLEPDNDLVRYVAQLKYEYEDEDEDLYAGFAEEVHTLQAGEDYRVMAVFPAPSLDVDSLTLQAGPFGEIADVPIEQ